MPVIAVVIPGGDSGDPMVYQPVQLLPGDFIGMRIDLVISARVAYSVVRFMVKEGAPEKG